MCANQRTGVIGSGYSAAVGSFLLDHTSVTSSPISRVVSRAGNRERARDSVHLLSAVPLPEGLGIRELQGDLAGEKILLQTPHCGKDSRGLGGRLGGSVS